MRTFQKCIQVTLCVSLLAIASCVVDKHDTLPITGHQGNQSAVGQNLSQDAWAVLRHGLVQETGWVRIHAAQALLRHSHPEDISHIFASEIDTAAPKYRIGVWRVMAQANIGVIRQAYTDRVLAAFLDQHGPDRLHAVETLLKLQYRNRPAELVRVAREENGPMQAYARAILALSGDYTDEDSLAELLGSPDTDTRIATAYSFCFLPQVRDSVLDQIKIAASQEAVGSSVRVYLYACWYVHAEENFRSLPKQELVKYTQTGNNEEKYMACAALGQGGSPADITLLEPLLQDVDVDVRISAAEAILSLRPIMNTNPDTSKSNNTEYNEPRR